MKKSIFLFAILMVLASCNSYVKEKYGADKDFKLRKGEISESVLYDYRHLVDVDNKNHYLDITIGTDGVHCNIGSFLLWDDKSDIVIYSASYIYNKTQIKFTSSDNWYFNEIEDYAFDLYNGYLIVGNHRFRERR
ncbi:hypothetical protein D0T49_04295 [Paludibacter sp. 221]|uniref:hypothetical protein n=1 Tax=Paludibacter sp. 221 TaxID=2302939 RepID=UPI0013D649F8|nr:hypothetical protein [Paludibacter sp. 221]NDV46260.1 hypothetical protein [Paludibacter sp. 221]